MKSIPMLILLINTDLISIKQKSYKNAMLSMLERKSILNLRIYFIFFPSIYWFIIKKKVAKCIKIMKFSWKKSMNTHLSRFTKVLSHCYVIAAEKIRRKKPYIQPFEVNEISLFLLLKIYNKRFRKEHDTIYRKFQAGSLIDVDWNFGLENVSCAAENIFGKVMFEKWWISGWIGSIKNTRWVKVNSCRIHVYLRNRPISANNTKWREKKLLLKRYTHWGICIYKNNNVG